MASISTDPNGNRTIQFVGQDGKRRSIRLGKIPAKSAVTLKIRVESLVASRFSRQPIDVETARWLGAIDDKLRSKLVAVGLAEAKETLAKIGVAGFVDDFLKRKSIGLKLNTILTYTNHADSVKAFFRNKSIEDVHRGDADDFRQSLVSKKLSVATISRRIVFVMSVFKDALRRRLISSNPFEGLKTGSQANSARQRFIDRDMIAKLLDACPSAEWRCLIALSRFGGLRVPSEPTLLRWSDIDLPNGKMLVSSPKTANHHGKANRIVPIFPELRPYLEDLEELAADGAVWVLPSFRGHVGNLAKNMAALIGRAGLERWPRAWHNLRASRQTELVEDFPAHVVSAWLGNSQACADRHYLQVTDSHFQKAVHALQKPVQQVSASVRNDSLVAEVISSEFPIFDGNQQIHAVYEGSTKESGDRKNKLENEAFEKCGANSGAHEDVSKLFELWKLLDHEHRQRLLMLAEEMTRIFS